ncbi:MAG: molybdenum cofactor guanylyltransferase [Candidatus Eremiobacteraeota bacterium]|nr:molybdenum cofactor guanylyltransferase [Candidatus Eremiobacteraeota bacterium]
MRSGRDGDIAVCILAGGEATRFPGKLQRDIRGVPLLRRTYESVREIGPVVVSVKLAPQAQSLPREAVTIVEDDRPGTGPLAALVSVFSTIAYPQIFVVAGDAPYAGKAVFEALRAAWIPECEAVVPVNRDGTLQPLTALYERTAFLRAAQHPAVAASGAVRRLVEELRVVRVTNLNERVFFNVNTEAEYRAAGEETW